MLVVNSLDQGLARLLTSRDGRVLTPIFVSMDHSPSEQIGHERHTLALVLSQAMEHHHFAEAIAKRLKREKLCRWKQAGPTYRRKFVRAAQELIGEFPIVVAVATANEALILDRLHQFLGHLGAQGAYRPVTRDGKQFVELGPVAEADGVPKIITVSARHAPMAAYTASYLLRILETLDRETAKLPEPMRPFGGAWIQVWSDKPPNDFEGPYSQALHMFMAASALGGRYTYGGFTGSEDAEIDLLVDNLAGFFHKALASNPNAELAAFASVQTTKSALVIEGLG